MDVITNYLLNLRNSIIGVVGPYFGWIKLASAIISALLLGGIIYFMKKTSFVNFKIEQYMDVLKAGDLLKHRSIKGWVQIQKKLTLGDEESLKSAVAEADRILYELLKNSGYEGETMDERLEKVDPSKLSNISDVWSAHKIKQRIVSEKEFQVTRQEAELIINIYKKSFQEFGLLD